MYPIYPRRFALPALVTLLACGLLALARLAAHAGEAPAYVWIEGEAPARCSVKPNVAGWGHKEFLSEEQWLQVSVDAEKVDAEVPGDGVHLEYPFTLASEG